jgi:hypothetical protein
VALPTSMAAATVRSPTGVQLQIHPSTEGRFAVELRRSTQSSTASTAWFTQQLDPSSGAFRVVVSLPLSTRSYYWQARHVGVGYSVGAYTPVVSAKPVKLSLGGTVPIVRGKNAAVEVPLGDVWLTSAKTVKVGTQATTATITKQVRFPAMVFKPMAPGTTYAYSLGTVTGAASVNSSLAAEYGLPKNIVVTKFRVFCARRTTGSVITTRLYRMSSAGIGTTVATLATTVNALAQTKESSALSITVASSRSLFAQMELRSNPTPNDGIVFWTEFDYTMGTYKDAF